MTAGALLHTAFRPIEDKSTRGNITPVLRGCAWRDSLDSWSGQERRALRRRPAPLRVSGEELGPFRVNGEEEAPFRVSGEELGPFRVNGEEEAPLGKRRPR